MKIIKSNIIPAGSDIAFFAFSTIIFKCNLSVNKLDKIYEMWYNFIDNGARLYQKCVSNAQKPVFRIVVLLLFLRIGTK